MGVPNRGGIGSHRRFLTNISLYPSATAEMVASNKTAKYAGLTSDYHFSRLRWSLLAVPMSSYSLPHGAVHHRASFLAASTQHSGDWLFALPIASSGLKLDDEAVRVTVGLRRGPDLCESHQCHCGAVVDARGLHSFVCKKRATGRSAKHHALNDSVAQSFAIAGVPSQKSQPGCPGRMESDRTVLHSSHGRAASRCVGTFKQ